MDIRNIIFLLVVSLLLFGTACAQKNVNDFKIDESYSGLYNGSFHSLYVNQNRGSGIVIFKNVVGDVDEDDDVHDNLIHGAGRDYLTPDDDMKIDKNPDNTFNFKDYDHVEHGVGEVIEYDGDSYTIVFWAKDSSHIINNDLISQLNKFNKDNAVKVIGF